MLATNSALTLGMHHSFFRHGLREFFSGAAAPSRGIGRAPTPTPPPGPAKRRRVQWLCPSGGGLQAKAIRACPVLDTGWASPRSSSFRCRLAWGRSFSTPANPSSVKRCLTRYTVPKATSRASATWGAGQPSSLLRRTRALAVTRAGCFPTRISRRSSSRCSGTNRTAYLSLTITATPANNTSHQAG